MVQQQVNSEQTLATACMRASAPNTLEPFHARNLSRLVPSLQLRHLGPVYRIDPLWSWPPGSRRHYFDLSRDGGRGERAVMVAHQRFDVVWRDGGRFADIFDRPALRGEAARFKMGATILSRDEAGKSAQPLRAIWINGAIRRTLFARTSRAAICIRWRDARALLEIRATGRSSRGDQRAGIRLVGTLALGQLPRGSGGTQLGPGAHAFLLVMDRVHSRGDIDHRDTPLAPILAKEVRCESSRNRTLANRRLVSLTEWQVFAPAGAMRERLNYEVG